MRVAILTALHSFESAYSPGKIIRDQVWMLERAGIEVVLYVKQGFDPKHGTLPCIAPVQVPGFMGRPVQTVASDFEARMLPELASYDAILAHDLFFLDMFRGYREGIRLVAPKIPARWFHWTHSTPRPQREAEGVPGHAFIALNHESVPSLAKMHSIPESAVRVVWNSSDVTDLLSPEAKGVVDELKLLDCDILGVLPFSVGRAKDKGIDKAMRVYARLGDNFRVKVFLAGCRMNMGKPRSEKARLDAEFKELGIEYWWATDVRPRWLEFVPNKVVRELTALSNLFLWATRGEACSLAIAEARTSGGPLVVLPEKGVQGMTEFSDEDCLLTDFSDPAKCAAAVEQLLPRWVRRLRRQHDWSRDGIWEKQLRPLLSPA